MPLPKPQIHPTGYGPVEKHNRIRPIKQSDRPQNQWQTKHGQRNVPVAQLPEWRLSDNQIGHYLLDRHANAANVAWEPVYVDIKQKPSVKRAYVQSEVEAGAQDSYTDVDKGEKLDDLELAPERLDELPAQPDGYDVHEDLPEVQLEETKRESGP